MDEEKQERKPTEEEQARALSELTGLLKRSPVAVGTRLANEQHYELPPPFFRLMLGRRVVDIVARAYTQPDHDFSYQNATFAELDKAIVGMATGYTAEQHRRSSRQPVKQAAGRRNLRMRIVLTLCAPLMRITDSIAEGDFYLQAIGD